jgi:hypothetical protein
MSLGPIRHLKPSDLQFIPEPTDFQQILSNELGNLGTDSDGFDTIFNEAAQLLSEAGSVLASFDGDLNDALGALPAFDTTAPGDFAASIQSAEKDGDSLLGTFTSAVAPAPQQGSNNPSSAGSAADCTPPSDNPAVVLGNMTVGDAPLEIYIDSYQSPTDPAIHVKTYCGDSAIFSTKKVDTRGGYGSETGAVTNHNFYFVVTPAKAGTFTGAYNEIDDAGNDNTYYYTVTITEAKSKGQLNPVRQTGVTL